MSILQTKAGNWRLARLQNAEDNGYPTRAMLLGRYNSTLWNSDKTHKNNLGDGTAQATARAVLWPNDSEDGDTYPNAIQWMPFGVGNADTTFLVRFLAWNLVEKRGLGVESWEWNWFKHSEWTCTLCTQTGITGSMIASAKYCDTIAIVSNAGNSNNYSVLSPQDNTPGIVTMDLLGAQAIEPIFTTGGSATSGNILYRWLY